ncbi:MAG: ATP-binding protein [Marmoricola sp.]
MRDVEAQLMHDMRNTAAVIRGAADMLHGGHRTMPAESIDHVTAMLARRSDMLARLFEDLATVSAIERGDLGLELQGVDLAEALRDVVAEHRERCGKEIVVDVEPGAKVLGDPVRIVQILDNLLSNAARYGGDTVSVRVGREAEQVRIDVTDDGPGVAPELVDTLFDLYSRGATSRQLGGSGLGLAIVQQLCTAQGGAISYDDSTGATFTARLPVLPATTDVLGADAAREGHAVSFWVADDDLADSVARYVAAGLVGGEAVLIAVTDDHRRKVEERLAGLGLDVDEARRLGQYTALDADVLRDALKVDDHVDPTVFTDLIASAVDRVREQWATFRVFGEIVDLYWRDGDGHLALELEGCWNELRSRVPFPLYCGYGIAADQDRVCGCHDAVLAA